MSQESNPEKPKNDPFENPADEVAAVEKFIAYAKLNDLLTKWINFHPEVTREEVDQAITDFYDALDEREESDSIDDSN